MSTEPTSEQADLLHFDIKRISPTELKQRQKTGKKILWSIGIIGALMIGITFLIAPSDNVTEVDEDLTESTAQEQPEYASNETANEVITEQKTESNESVNTPEQSLEYNIASQSQTSDSIKQNTIKTPEKETPPKEQKVVKEEKQENLAKKELQSELKYYLIAGSFDNENNAIKLVKQLESSGHWAINLGKLGSSYKVSIGAYETKSEADNKRKELMRNGVETWVLNH